MSSRATRNQFIGSVDTLLRGVPPSGSRAYALSTQVRLLAMLGSASPLNELLDGLVRYVESWAEGLLCTVLLVDSTGRQLVPGAAPSIAPEYASAIGPVPIEEGKGSCGTAAARREMVIVDDVETSPFWASHASIAVSFGLRACWSVPIVDDSGRLLGTLAAYYREPRSPSAEETDLIRFAASLAAFVIQRHQDAERVRNSEARLEAAVAGTDIGLWDGDVSGDYRWADDWCERFDIDSCTGPGSLERWRARIHPEDFERYVRIGDDTIYGTLDHYAVEYRVLTRGGQWRWLHERGRVTARDARGMGTHYVGVCINIQPRKQMEDALRSAEARYELAIGAARLPVWEYDVPHDAVRANIYWYLALGYDVADSQTVNRTETWLSDIHPDDAANHDRVYSSSAADGTGFYQGEFRVRTASGGYKWLLDRGRVVERAADGSPLKVVGVSIDIDAQKTMECALRESEERFRSAFEFAGIGMALVATDGRWLRVNSSLCRILGYSAEELLATTFQAITHPEDVEANVGVAREMLDGDLSHVDFEKRYIHKDGHTVWALLSVSVARGAAHDALYFVSQVQDITSRKDAERRVLESESRYRTIANFVPGFVFEGEVRGGYPRPTWVSDGFEHVFGCSMQEFCERGVKQFYDSATRQTILAGARRLADGATHSAELSLRSLDGTQRWLEVIARVVPSDHEPGIDRVVGVAADITERKRLEMALGEATYQEQQRIGKEMHDGLGQELAGLAYFVGSLAGEADRTHSPLTADLGKVARLASHAIETCRGIARGVSPLTESRGSLVESLRRICEMARVGNRARVDFSVIENAPLTLPLESLDHLHRIAQEALNNALKHSGATTIEVSIEVEPKRVRIEVLDDGRGFGPTGPRATGLGLGLDSMRQRAAAIGAQLRIGTRRRGGAALVCECPQKPAH